MNGFKKVKQMDLKKKKLEDQVTVFLGIELGIKSFKLVTVDKAS